MRATFIPLAFFLSTVIFLSSCTLTTYAYEEIGQAQIHPSHPVYFLKTIRESIEIKFAGTKRTSILRRLEFATRRLREVKSLVSVRRFELIIPTLEKYWFQVSALPYSGLDDKTVSQMITHNLGNHLEVLEQIYLQIEDKDAKRAIRGTVNKLIQREDLTKSAKLIGCNLLAKESSSSALLEVEREILKERVERCSKL